MLKVSLSDQNFTLACNGFVGAECIHYELVSTSLWPLEITKVDLELFCMPLPLVPVVAALNAGGHLVAHSAGGLIVYSSTAGGYVAGTYISSASLASFLTGTAAVSASAGTVLLGAAAIWAYGTVGGVFTTLIGGAGFFGTTIGATGITGVLMSLGFIDSVPVFVPVFFGLAALLLLLLALYYSSSFRRISIKVQAVPDGEETMYTKREAKLVEKLVRSASKPHSI